jgi:hypothetical protein
MSSAADKLNRIRGGGAMMVVNGLNRLSEAEKYLRDGNFTAANQSIGAVYALTQELARMDSLIGSFSDASPVMVGDLEVGMHLHEIGEITDIEFHECSDTCGGHADIKVGDREFPLACNFEVLVDRNG